MIENSWHWLRDTQLREDAHGYRESTGVRIDGFWSITERLAALAHDIRGFLALVGWQEQDQALCLAWLLMSPAQSGAS